MNKQVFLKLMLMTTSKYVLSRVLKTLDIKMFQTDGMEVAYLCDDCKYVTTKNLSHVGCLEVLTSQNIDFENTSTIENYIYEEAY